MCRLQHKYRDLLEHEQTKLKTYQDEYALNIKDGHWATAQETKKLIYSSHEKQSMYTDFLTDLAYL